MKLPPYMADANGYCHPSTWDLVQATALTPWWGQIDQDGYAVPGTEPLPRWHGQTVVCVASGPSLTEEDCGLVQAAGLPTVTANDSWRRAPFAEVMYATDHGWWQQHTHEITTSAERWTDSVPAAQEFGLYLHVSRASSCNSGARTIELAMDLGASRVLLLGFDCSLERGVHWHGEHTRTGNPDEGAIGRWAEQFGVLAQLARKRGVEVVNCSRQTALTCFSRQDMCKALDKLKKMEVGLNT